MKSLFSNFSGVVWTGSKCAWSFEISLTSLFCFVSGEFGGNMGLFLGCSILTLCEFIDFLWEVVMYRLRKRSVDMTQKAGNNT